MSMPMICSAARRASSAVFASLIPPAFPRPPTGTCALTATGPSFEKAAAASSALRATMPGGMAMPREARTSLAWYSRSFTRLGRRGVEWTGSAGLLRVVLPAVAEAPLEVGVGHDDDAADHQQQDDHQAKAASDQNRGQRDASPARLSLHTDWSPG